MKKLLEGLVVTIGVIGMMAFSIVLYSLPIVVAIWIVLKIF